jgi:hypothetical protein
MTHVGYIEIVAHLSTPHAKITQRLSSVQGPPPPSRPTSTAPGELRSAASEGEQAGGESTQAWEANPEILAREPRNLLLIALYDVIVRIGWIFKTESVIMPAFLDLVAGAGWLRGCLPVVNRFGQSVPPVFFSHRLRRMRHKKWALALWTLSMGIPFLALSGAWYVFGDAPPHWMAGLFLMLYAMFSCFHGLNQLSFGTLQGKLIRVSRRGRLMAVSVLFGSVLAIVFAWWLLGDWLRLRDGGFDYIFGFTGACFVLGALAALAVAEPGDQSHPSNEVVRHPFARAWQIFRVDANFRRLAIVAALSSTGVILFPHYQALARERLQLTNVNLMVWVVVQNAAMGVFGVVLGWLADRRGERLSLRLALFGTAVAPLAAIILVHIGYEAGREWFWLSFLCLGMTPISQKTMVGYTLEISPPADHPGYLATLSLCLAVPFVFSPLVGWLADITNFETIFLTGAALLWLCGLMTFRLAEPGHHDHHAPLELVPAATED